MNPSPTEYIESLRIGVVDYVSPDEIKVSLDIEAPESIALNAGFPRSFPKIHNYLLIPGDEGFLVGQVVWLTIENSPYPKRRGMKDFGLVDLPYPLRKMSLNPLGCLQERQDNYLEQYKNIYIFQRGIKSFPSVGDKVILPTQEQLKAIVESNPNGQIKIGTSPLATNAEVKVDPDKLFGGHLAILGSTGSGKSCSVAGLIRWSLEALNKYEYSNAHFIVFDPNGEYSKSFNENINNLNIHIFKIATLEEDKQYQLKVPMWFWNISEWLSFTKASEGIQQPILIQALQKIKKHAAVDAPIKFTIDDLLKTIEELGSKNFKWKDFLTPLQLRIDMMFNDERLKPIINPDDDITLENWLNQYIGSPNSSKSNLTIIDLSLVPSDIIHLITAVIARIVFESLQYYRKLHPENLSFPLVLVMDEAHTFIKKYYKYNESMYDASVVCSQVFERIAREGRKFGLGLVLASQRPSELSPTVLSQCNTFLLHRITNDVDQKLIYHLIPENFKGILRELPSLPPQNAILLGWATELPLLVRMRDLPYSQCPQSNNPDFWAVWSKEHHRDISWKKIVDDWQK